MAVVVALVLSLGTFILVSGKAWAQQPPQEQQQQAEVTQRVLIDGEATEHVPGTLPAASVPVKTPPASTPLVDPVPSIDQYDPGTSSEPEPSPPEPSIRHEPEVALDLEPAPSAPGPLTQHHIETPVDAGPAPGRSRLPESVPTPQPDPVSSLDPAPASPLDPAPSAPGPLTRHHIETPVDAGPAPGGSRLPESAPTPQPDPVSSLDPAPASPLDPAPMPEPVIFEENEPLSSPAEEAPASVSTVPDLGQEELYPPTSLETAASSAVETLEIAANALGSLTDRSSLFWSSAKDQQGSIGAALVDLFSGGEATFTPAAEASVENLGSPSDGTGSPSRDSTPQPTYPFVPPPAGSSYFSLSGGGEIGHGGVATLLLYVLVSVSILLRWDRRISWAFCDYSKPSSALLLPLERPG
jgi:hypothetical protein